MNCLFSIVDIVLLLGDVYRAADQVVSHLSGGHGCGERCLLRSIRSMDEGEVVSSCCYDGDEDGNRKNLCRRDEGRTPGSCIVT